MIDDDRKNCTKKLTCTILSIIQSARDHVRVWNKKKVR